MLPTQEFKEDWSLLNRIIFRFSFLFIIGFIFFMITNSLFEPLLAWLGKTFFNLKENLQIKSTGSGDRIMSWLSLFFQLIIAITGTVIWSIIDRKRDSYNKLYYIFRSIVRVFVSFFMLVYGFAKVFLIQFQEPTLSQLVTPLGDMSPMGLAWTYMGFSPAFGIFTGLLEVIAGLLLIPRRTQTMGALMTLGIMIHVFIMNLCFDIPVKIFSFHLALMGLVLLLSYRNKLKQAFFNPKNDSTPTYYTPIKQEAHRPIRIIKLIGISLVILISLTLGFLNYNLVNDGPGKDDYYGIWEIKSLIKNGDTLPSLTTSHNQWRYMLMEANGRTNIQTMDGDISAYHFKIDSTDVGLSLYHRDSTEVKNNFNIIKKDSIHLHINGVLNKDSLDIQLKIKNLEKFTLINRGFNWVSETPYNQ